MDTSLTVLSIHEQIFTTPGATQRLASHERLFQHELPRLGQYAQTCDVLYCETQAPAVSCTCGLYALIWESVPPSSLSPRLSTIERWLQRADDELLYTPQGEDDSLPLPRHDDRVPSSAETPALMLSPTIRHLLPPMAPHDLLDVLFGPSQADADLFHHRISPDEGVVHAHPCD